MELSELKFAVNTAELKEAVELLGKVQQGTAALGKAQGEQEKPAKRAAKGQEDLNGALGETEKKISPLEKLLQKLNNQYGDLVKGFTKGEASILQQARNYGAAEDALQPFIVELEKIKELTKDPFDASVGAIRSVSAEFDKLSQRAELAQKGISLSNKQLSEYSRISAEVKGKVLELGLDPKSATGIEKYNQLLSENRNEYLRVAAAANALEQAESLRNKALREAERLAASNLKDQTRDSNKAKTQAIRDQAQATKWLATEDARMASVVDTLTQAQSRGVDVSEKAARSIAAYERNLAKAALTGEDATTKLEAYRKRQQSVQDLEQARQGKQLTRALQPQIGDIAVSLAAGQNPLTVLLQQGDQIKGLVAQSGLVGEKLRESMRNALTETVTSIKTTAVAMSDVVLGAFTSIGKNVLGLITGPFAAFGAAMAAGAGAAGSLEAAMAALNAAFIRLVGNPVIAALVATAAVLATLGIAAYKSMTQYSDLNKAMVLNGAVMKMSAGEAVDLAKSLDTTGGSASKYVDVMTAMAKEGLNVGSNFKGVADSAINMQKYLGVSIEDTIKKYKQLTTDPLKGLTDLTSTIGGVSAETIKLVAELERQGKSHEAIEIAVKAQVDAEKAAVAKSLENAGYVERMWTATISGIASMWEKFRSAVMGWGATDTISAQIASLQEANKKLTDGAPHGYAAEIDFNNAKITSLQEQQKLLLKSKEIESQREQLARDMVGHQNTLNEAITQQGKREKALKEAREQNQRLLDAGQIDQSSADAVIKAIEEKYKDKKDPAKSTKAESDAARELAKSLELYNDVINKSTGYNKEFNNSILSLMIARDKGKKTQDEYTDAVNALVKQQPFYAQQEKDIADATKRRADNQEWLNSLMGRSEGLSKDYTQGGERLLQMLGAGDINSEQFNAALAALNKLTPAYKAYEVVLANYGKTVADLEIQRKATAGEYGMDFKTDKEKAELQSLSNFKKSLAQADAEYEKSVADAKKFLGSTEYDSMIAKAKDVANRRRGIAQDLYAREKYLQSQTYQMYAAGFEALKGLSANFSTAVADQFINFAKTGKSSFEDLTSSFGNMVQNMIYDLIRLQIQKQVAGLLDTGISAFTSYMTSGTSTGSSQYSLTSGGSTGLSSMGGGTGLTVSKALADGGAFKNGVQMFANGGVFDGPTMFAHSGGLGVLGEAGAEAVMPLKRDANGSLGVAVNGGSSSSNVDVVVNNYGSEKATTTETTDSRGNRKINVTIGEMVAGEVARSGSSMQKSLQSTYGQRPQLIRR